MVRQQQQARAGVLGFAGGEVWLTSGNRKFGGGRVLVDLVGAGCRLPVDLVAVSLSIGTTSPVDLRNIIRG